MILPTIVTFLIIAVSIAFIIGIIKPSLILKWVENPTRVKVLAYSFTANFVLFILLAILMPSQTSAERISLSENYLKEGKYSMAKSSLLSIEKNDSLYTKAQFLVVKADSLIANEERVKKIKEEKAKEEARLKKEAKEKIKRKENLSKQKEQLQREIESIKKGVDFSTYKKTVESLQMELILFGTWAKLIDESEKYEDKKIKRLTSDLKRRVINLQVREFPKMRSVYGKLMGEKLWRSDIKVKVNGKGKKYINFSGGLFASNANKEDFQEKISEGLNLYRFKQSRYRWYDGASEYTYWTIYKGRDSDLVRFN